MDFLRFRWDMLMSGTLRCDAFEKGNKMQCERCGDEAFTKVGRDRQARQLFRCSACGRRMTERSRTAFSGYRFPDDVIALAVRWYLRCRLLYADVAELLAERGVEVDPSTVYDRVREFAPRYEDAARHFRRAVGSCIGRSLHPASISGSRDPRVPRSSYGWR